VSTYTHPLGLDRAWPPDGLWCTRVKKCGNHLVDFAWLSRIEARLMTFQGWKIWTLNSMTFQDLYTPCHTQKHTSLKKSCYFNHRIEQAQDSECCNSSIKMRCDALWQLSDSKRPCKYTQLSTATQWHHNRIIGSLRRWWTLFVW